MFDKLKEEDMETLKAMPDTERYIKPVTEITHLNNIEQEAVGSKQEGETELNTKEKREELLDDRSIEEVKAEEQSEDLYNIAKFSI